MTLARTSFLRVEGCVKDAYMWPFVFSRFQIHENAIFPQGIQADLVMNKPKKGSDSEKC